MNFLAHLYLSNNNPDLMIGNFIADVIKGNQYKKFKPEIQKGIILHRHIDTFTDQHDIVKKSKRRLHKRYNHYNGIIIDLFYDHYLAKNWSVYSNTDLQLFVTNFYQLLDKRYDELPEKTQQMIPHLKQYDWLYNYQFFEGMEDVLNGMNRRTKLKSQMHLAITDLKENHEIFEEDFTTFFKELIIFSKQKTLALENHIFIQDLTM